MAVRSELEERIRQDPWDTIIMAILLALSAIVLAIACANVANLMLGRGRARSREMSIRLALGVSRSRLFRQLLTESLLLALMGLALGLGVAYGGIRFLQTIPTGDQIAIVPQLDQRVLIFGLIMAAASAMLFGRRRGQASRRTWCRGSKEHAGKQGRNGASASAGPSWRRRSRSRWCSWWERDCSGAA